MPTREEMRSLAEEIVGSYADRVVGLAQLRETVKMDLKGFQNSRTAMAKEIRADLARSVTNRRREVGSMLKELNSAHAAMSKELKADLAKGVANRKHEVGHMLRGFSAELKDIRSELAGGRDEWQVLTATMQAHRVGPAVEVKPSLEETTEEAAG